MAIKVALTHTTEFTYDRLVTLTPQVVRLKPAPHCRTPIKSYSLKIEPSEHFINWQQDPYNNYLARIIFPEPTRKFKVTVGLIAEMISINSFDFFLEDYADNFPFLYEEGLKKELAPFLETRENGPCLLSYIEKYLNKKIRTVDFLVSLNMDLQKHIGYVIRLESGVQSPEETLTVTKGSCRDTAWLLVHILRNLGLAARFVSGYLIQLTADTQSLDGPKGTDKDFTDLHAWTEVYLPGAGWIGLDPTSGMLAGEGHIPLACSADPGQAAPTSGSFTFEKNPDIVDDECKSEFKFNMSIFRIEDTPRVTKPYTDDQWSSICDVGNKIDNYLNSYDVKLTLGGEPTFVSVDDKDGEEWNTSALGSTKSLFADTLLHRLKNKFSPGGFLHHGQGKWYPGESLPRWAFSCYWRKDLVPIWSDSDLFARENTTYNFSEVDAKKFLDELAGRLCVNINFVQPAYEDLWYFMWREQRLPTNVSPLKNNHDNPEERNRISKIFNQGLGKVVGYVLPLKYESLSNKKHWVSCKWLLRRENIFLIPGDSPMGYRLPLDSITWIDPKDRDQTFNHCPLTPVDLLPKFQSKINSSINTKNIDPTLPADSAIRTSLCVETRDGRIKVFIPPLDSVVEYLELLKNIESTARYLGYPIQIEGYPPPYDTRLLNFKITPDPGVIEVNIHPSSSWVDLYEKSFIIHEEAKKTKLCSEKFMLDGRHTGTGGGSHIVLGGPSPSESPFLRRPDLLRSMLSYWNNHPSLSYLFSGLFVGPTCQAPRLDESRLDIITELEIAFEQIPDNGNALPWLVDRVYRHLLVDSSGNTHRSEFCIDKLYSPDSSTGRLGLLELRGFEMAPDPKMGLVQNLLVNALIAMFWNKPYKQKMIRWGTQLHDKFMLPHFLVDDLRDVVLELQAFGFGLDENWFKPHLEFRFPKIGSICKDNINLELRGALEPWRVLGEENNPSGTVRFVDSSLERIQLKVEGLIDTRHVILCNGSRIPFHPTGINGEYVAGIRYRAWQPSSCLHPTIPVHCPLVFDLYDTWMSRSVGGCTYHVAHPGGRSYDRFPVNAIEAEGRRLSRFIKEGHTADQFGIIDEEIRPDSPFTLDLRYEGKHQWFKKHSNDKISEPDSYDIRPKVSKVNGIVSPVISGLS